MKFFLIISLLPFSLALPRIPSFGSPLRNIAVDGNPVAPIANDVRINRQIALMEERARRNANPALQNPQGEARNLLNDFNAANENPLPAHPLGNDVRINRQIALMEERARRNANPALQNPQGEARNLLNDFNAANAANGRNLVTPEDVRMRNWNFNRGNDQNIVTHGSRTGTRRPAPPRSPASPERDAARRRLFE
jgi:hypothetical protein